MLYLKFDLSSDYAGCIYTLMMGNIFIKSWHITYGYNVPEWIERERSDRERMKQELQNLGLDFISLEVKCD